MHYTIIIILIFLTICLLVLVWLQSRKMKQIRRESKVNQLKLTQYRYQSDPHALLNQINSLASFPTRIQPSLMQAKILAFGKQLRHLLTFSADLTSMLNKQVDAVKQLVELENQNNDTLISLEVSPFSLIAGFEALPAHLLPNIVHGIIRSRDTTTVQLIKIDIKHATDQLIITIDADNVRSNDPQKGLAGELLQMQLQYFNGHTARKVEITNLPSAHNQHNRVVRINFK